MAGAIAGLPDPAVTGAMVTVTGPAGSWGGTSGVGDIRTRRPVPADGRFRIGSISKVFTAVVVLQLAAEHRIDLGEPVQRYLPDLLPASYPDITVRELLNHTSGLPEGTLGSGDAAWFAAHRFDSWTPRQIVDEATAHPMRFAPGTQQQYNGTNYYVAGLLVEKVTGHSYADEVGRRILKPLGLHDTFVLDRRDPRLPGPHSHGYVAVTGDGTTTLHDVSRPHHDHAAQRRHGVGQDRVRTRLHERGLRHPRPAAGPRLLDEPDGQRGRLGDPVRREDRRSDLRPRAGGGVARAHRPKTLRSSANKTW
jgi:D-alanyl-D-alanine carboxypeptidase